jgi:hypothetical protein
MVCLTSCALAVAFIAAAIYISINSKSTTQEFEKTLDPAQKAIYQKIVNERMKIYLIASAIGAVLGILYIIGMRKKQSTMALVCIAVVIFFVTQIIVYMVWPKTGYMLNYVNTNEQSKAWMAVYNDMMNNYLIGFVLGLIGYGIICYAFLI